VQLAVVDDERAAAKLRRAGIIMGGFQSSRKEGEI
jgi:hypothetical protein